MSLLIKGVTKHAQLTDVSTPHTLADLVAAVCSETELATAIATHAAVAAAHHAKYTNAEAIAAAKIDNALLNPSEMIILWHGTIANIPTGWLICDGNNSTPNLLTRFVQGVATAATDPGATGGATSKSHAAHTHTMPSHYHTMPSHSHTVDRQTLRIADAALEYLAKDGPTSSDDPGDTNSKDPGDTNSTTVTAHSDIRPLFYDVAFLMKT